MIRLSHRAQKDLGDLPPAMQDKAQALIARLDAEPALGKKLLGKFMGYRVARLGRSHRIIYKLEDEGPLIMTVGPRRDVYR